MCILNTNISDQQLPINKGAKLSLLKCSPVTDLLYICEIQEYYEESQGGYDIYIIPIKDINAYYLYECVKNLDIYLQNTHIYLSDYILLKKKPTQSILTIFNHFNTDDLFQHCLSQQNIIKAHQKIQCNKNDNIYAESY